MEREVKKTSCIAPTLTYVITVEALGGTPKGGFPDERTFKLRPKNESQPGERESLSRGNSTYGNHKARKSMVLQELNAAMIYGEAIEQLIK